MRPRRTRMRLILIACVAILVVTGVLYRESLAVLLFSARLDLQPETWEQLLGHPESSARSRALRRFVATARGADRFQQAVLRAGFEFFHERHPRRLPSQMFTNEYFVLELARTDEGARCNVSVGAFSPDSLLVTTPPVKLWVPLAPDSRLGQLSSLVGVAAIHESVDTSSTPFGPVKNTFIQTPSSLHCIVSQASLAHPDPEELRAQIASHSGEGSQG